MREPLYCVIMCVGTRVLQPQQTEGTRSYSQHHTLTSLEQATSSHFLKQSHLDSKLDLTFINTGDRKPCHISVIGNPVIMLVIGNCNNAGDRKPCHISGDRKPSNNAGDRKPCHISGDRKPSNNTGDMKPVIGNPVIMM